MCEVWSDGAVPFGQYKSVVDVCVAVLQGGARAAIPSAAPSQQAQVIRQLFSTNPSDRPSLPGVFARIRAGARDDGDDDCAVDESAPNDNGEYVAADQL